MKTVRVRSAAEIRKTLGLLGTCEGVRFFPAMYDFADRTFAIRKQIADVHEHFARRPLRTPLFILEGVACDGRIAKTKGACDRGCPFLWHPRWLDFEEAGGDAV